MFWLIKVINGISMLDFTPSYFFCPLFRGVIFVLSFTITISVVCNPTACENIIRVFCFLLHSPTHGSHLPYWQKEPLHVARLKVACFWDELSNIVIFIFCFPSCDIFSNFVFEPRAIFTDQKNPRGTGRLTMILLAATLG